MSRISLKFVSFILTPVISVYFSVTEYGILDRFERFWQILFAISLFGMETALLRWYTLTEDKEKRKSLVFSVLLFLFFINGLLVVTGTVLSQQLSNVIFDTPVYRNIVIFTFLIACFEALMVIPLSILRAQNRPGRYLLVTISATVISMLMQLYFLIYTNNKLEGIFISKFTAPCITFIFMLPLLYSNLKFEIDKEKLKDIVKFSFPLMLTGVVSMLLNSVNRFILGFVGKPEEVGLFGLASNMSGIITFVLISPFQLAFNAIFWQKLKDSNAARFYTKSVTYSVFLYVWGALVLSLLIPFVIKIYIPTSPSYWASIKLVPILSFSLVFYGMLTISYMSYHHAKRNDLILYFNIGALLTNIILNYWLIPVWGMFGAALSTFISSFLLIWGMYYFSKKFYFIKYETSKLIVVFAAAVLLVLPFYYLNIASKPIDIILRCIICIVFPMVFIPFGFYEKVEIQTARSFIKKYLRLNV